MDFEQTYDYFNQLKGCSFGDIPEIMLEFANYNTAMKTLLDEGEPVSEEKIKLEFPRLYDEKAVTNVLAEFNKLDFENMENFDDYEDIRDVCLGLKNTFAYAQEHNFIVVLYRLI